MSHLASTSLPSPRTERKNAKGQEKDRHDGRPINNNVEKERAGTEAKDVGAGSGYEINDRVLIKPLLHVKTHEITFYIFVS